MTALSLREAVKLFNVSRPTLTKALKDGRISGFRDNAGNWQIEPSELQRLYQGRGGKAVKQSQATPSNLTSLSPAKIDRAADTSAVRIAQLEAQLDAERTARELVERHLADLRALLPSPARRRWWPW